MFNRTNPKQDMLDLAIAETFTDLKGYTAERDEHSKIVSQLTELYALQPKGVDRNAMLMALSNVAIAVAVLNYEKTGVVTTKLFQFLGKMR